MHIYLIDNNINTVNAWSQYFSDNPDFTIFHGGFDFFMQTHKVDCIVSPTNSYGLMDGGYDLAITEWFGRDLMSHVQSYILEHFRGEQPVGSSVFIDTGTIKLIHTPTMRIPSRIKDPMVVYTCMRTCLILALEKKISSILIPAFGGGCGAVPSETIANMMSLAYNQVMNPPSEITWNYAERCYPEYYEDLFT
ncbi:MAG: macro domain-containing protein [Clostridiales bacterium]|nr:macro domain-containing protein [Clostridiales bacterium]